MPALFTTDEVMLQRYRCIRSQNGNAVVRTPIELVDATAHPFDLAYELIGRRLASMQGSVNNWLHVWQPQVHIVDEPNVAFAYALKGSTDTNWIFLSSKLVDDLHWYAGNIGIKCAIPLNSGPGMSHDFVDGWEKTVFDAVLGYYLEHELAHHLDGHLGYMETVKLTPVASQALELAADTFAFEKLIYAELERMARNMAGRADPMSAVFASTLSFLAVLPPMRNKNNPKLVIHQKPHPHSAYRQLVGLSMWSKSLSECLDFDALEFVLNCTQVVICAYLERSGKADRERAELWRAMLNERESLPFLRDADLRKVLYDPHVHGYGNAMADRYEKISPALAPFRRIQNNALSDHWRFS